MNTKKGRVGRDMVIAVVKVGADVRGTCLDRQGNLQLDQVACSSVVTQSVHQSCRIRVALGSVPRCHTSTDSCWTQVARGSTSCLYPPSG